MADSLGNRGDGLGRAGQRTADRQICAGSRTIQVAAIPIPAHYLDLGAKIAEIATRHGASPAQVALAWLLDRNVIPVIGASSPRQIADNVGMFDLRLDPAAVAELDALAPPTLDYPHQLLASSFMDDRVFAGRRGDFRGSELSR